MATLPTVSFCGLRVSRLLIGANPFAGFSHQSSARDEAMKRWHTVERILETWDRAAKAGITAFVTNNTTPHVVAAVDSYLRDRGPMAWIAQVSDAASPGMEAAVDRCVGMGCAALFFHGGLVDGLYARRDHATLERWVAHARRSGRPVGVAGHSPDLHDWVAAMGLADFHAVPFFDCGSLHAGEGDRFRLEDVPRAVDCIRRLRAPCMAYKILGAGRIDAAMGLAHAFQGIKPTDVVNLGMHRGDNDAMVEENADIVRRVLARQPSDG